MPEPRELPGFYWDPQKKRYFAIQKNSAGPGSQHSVDNVAKKQHEAKRRKLDEQRRQESDATTVQRSHITRSAINNAALLRESGLLRPSDMRKAQAAVAAEMPLDFRICFSEGRGSFRSAGSDFSPAYGARCVASMTGTRKARIELHNIWGNPDRSNPPGTASFRIGSLGSTGTSLSTSDDGAILATASISNSHNVLFSGVASFEALMESSAPVVTARLGSEDTELTASALVSGGNGGTNGIVVAKREGHGGEMWLLDVNEAKIVHNPQRFPGQHLLSADWMDSHTAAMGSRSGTVHLWDARSSDGARRFQHPGAIAQLRSAGDGLGVWAVSMNAIHKYDTRMVNRADNSSTAPVVSSYACSPHKRCKRCRRYGSKSTSETTEPVARIACDVKDNSRLSVWKELGLVAVSKYGCLIRFYDGKTGEDTGACMSTDDHDVYRMDDRTPQERAQDSIGGISTGVDHDGEPYLMYSVNHMVRKCILGGRFAEVQARSAEDTL